MALPEWLPDWLDTMGLINLAIFGVILVAGAIMIPWARSQARATEARWQATVKPTLDAASQAMDQLNADLRRASEAVAKHGDAVVARVRKDSGRRGR